MAFETVTDWESKSQEIWVKIAGHCVQWMVMPPDWLNDYSPEEQMLGLVKSCGDIANDCGGVVDTCDLIDVIRTVREAYSRVRDENLHFDDPSAHCLHVFKKAREISGENLGA